MVINVSDPFFKCLMTFGACVFIDRHDRLRFCSLCKNIKKACIERTQAYVVSNALKRLKKLVEEGKRCFPFMSDLLLCSRLSLVDASFQTLLAAMATTIEFFFALYLFVSHDETFLRQIATRGVRIENRKLITM